MCLAVFSESEEILIDQRGMWRALGYFYVNSTKLVIFFKNFAYSEHSCMYAPNELTQVQ